MSAPRSQLPNDLRPGVGGGTPEQQFALLRLPADGIPLCVDLDGTLVRTDTLLESILALLRDKPFCLFLLPLWLLRGKAWFKHQIAKRAALDVESLPYNKPLLELLRRERANGRRLVLVTACDQALARRIAEHVACFDAIYASDGRTNLKGRKKLGVLLDQFGPRRFMYVGNSAPDLFIWQQAALAVVINPSGKVRRAIGRGTLRADQVVDDRASRLLSFAKAVRIVQWSKNILLFVPLVLAHRFTDPQRVLHVACAFLAFSLCASAVYLLNDLWDLDADRRHPTKRNRPFAAGDLPLGASVWMAPALLTLAGLLVAAVGGRFILWLLMYLLFTLAYLFWLKRLVLLDVVVLATLYTLRILAGAAAAEVPLSEWFAAFSLFFFLSLALLKRYSELRVLRFDGGEEIAGRGYRPVDLELLPGLGSSSAYLSCLVLALYINSPEVRELYSRPNTLWLLIPLIVYWSSRVWLLANRGEMHEDPVVFALTDRVSWGVVLSMLAVLFLGGMM
ncbi:MAG: UbiA family prenyltransferase [Armatimonadetes bacterium]|nr:UbiA family prenyltransferase [Armatimonadota bacterium]